MRHSRHAGHSRRATRDTARDTTPGTVSAGRGTGANGRTRTALAVLAGTCLTAGVLAPGTAVARPADGGTARAVPAVERISVAQDGAQGNGPSHSSSISADGRTVTFLSAAGNLVPGDTDGATDIFIRSLSTGRTQRLEFGRPGLEPVALSADAEGRRGVVETYQYDPVTGEQTQELWVYDRDSGRVRPMLPGGPTLAGIQQAVISADGRSVAFQSTRADLVPGDTNGIADIFVHDLRRGTTKRVNVFSDGTQADRAAAGPSLSADGSRVLFISRTDLAPGPEGPGPGEPGAGTARKPISYPAFVHDLRTGRTEAASMGHDNATVGAISASLSADGRYALFSSRYVDVVPGDTNNQIDLFRRDLRRGTVERVSLAHDGAEPQGGESWNGVLSADGRTLLFNSVANNLVPGDTNDGEDLFARDLRTGAVERLPVTPDGSALPWDVYGYTTDARGRTVAFDSGSAALVPEDTNGVSDVYVLRRRS
ncbi:hypothetical protein NX801_03775 [Streptomyces sp. LP05-1]|uniref:WD40 repeat protein n=1 Tax=Streptomyces pyxinae TaxID=2970734 RepID=A0ABT2CBL3_9ACTN|nr:hypothetical protein [Streptomyces sp. LP05-1]MCS0634790.1 hypothetical protein [Streptomyces sp. LP05-1]